MWWHLPASIARTGSGGTDAGPLLQGEVLDVERQRLAGLAGIDAAVDLVRRRCRTVHLLDARVARILRSRWIRNQRLQTSAVLVRTADPSGRGGIMSAEPAGFGSG